MRMLRKWENSGNRNKGTRKDYHGAGKLGMQGKGHKDSITGAERQWEEDTFM